MLSQRRRATVFFTALMVIQVLSPFALVSGQESNPSPETSADLQALAQLGITPMATAEFGWLHAEDGTDHSALRFRDVTLVSPSEWSERTGETRVDGFHILSHTYPVPSEWHGQLAAAGIDCFSFLPPTGFHCDVRSVTPSQLTALNVQGIARMDAVDKVQMDLVRGLLGLEMHAFNPFVSEHGAIVNVVLAGEDLPESWRQRGDIAVDSHSGRFATLVLETEALGWLARQDSVEWIEAKPFYQLVNSKAIEVMNVTDVWSGTNMAAIDSGWSGLDGTGVIVTVADTGLDNGVNNSNMHPDFRDHITAIYSFAPSAATCAAYGLSAPCGDDAEDHHGHGTHVAGSALGDGTHSNGAIIGAAPEAHLLVHSIATTVGSSEYLIGIPNDLDDMFKLAWANGSRVHTNSWGSDVDGEYTSSSMQADASARTHDELVILFAAANEGEDADGDGEVDLGSLGSPATAKNVLTVGASENDRSNISSVYGSSYGSPISTDKYADNIEGMAAFSSRGPTEDDRIKPDVSAPGTFILSTKSRSTSSTGWMAHNASYTYMGGTSMATPLTAGATALLLQHLMDNEGETAPTSALIKAIMAASAHDMAGQYSSSTNGARETAPNNHEGWGLVNMTQAINTSWLQGHSVTTNAERGWSFNVPANAEDINIVLSWTDPASTPSASSHLVNDLDLAIKSPGGTWTNLSNDDDNLRGVKLSSPAQGTWEVHVLGSSIPTGPQFFALALTGDYSLTNLTQDTDSDGYEDSDDDCSTLAGTSTVDRTGCPDTDNDGYSNPDSNWTVNNGADAFPSDSTQWADTDFDGYGDNSAGTEPDACINLAGNSSADRYGCTDTDGDGFSDPDSGWTTSNGADACSSVSGPSDEDRNGCPDQDGDGYSDADSGWTTSNGADAFPTDDTQWEDSDGDGYGDNPPPATSGDGCPSTSGTSDQDRYGCTDTDGDGYSDPDLLWTTSEGADAFVSDNTQWSDGDGDGYGDNASGNNPDACPSQFGTSTEAGRLGCTDTDGDGYADVDDAFPSETTQWNDTDGDGYGDELTGFEGDACPSTSGDSTRDRFGCTDSDSDGSSDGDANWTVADGADIAPNDSTQWLDSDGDGYGDNPSGTNGDACPLVNGNSTNDRLGCPDTDGDGYSNPDLIWTEDDGADAYPNDPLRWGDNDDDGFDDGLDDDCPTLFGTSIHDRKGCPDQDGDGYSDPDSGWTTGNGADAFMTDSTQWNDTDDDGYGDNPTGSLPDACPTTYGESWQNGTFGCPDADEDGWANAEDSHPDEQTQWSDVDGDGYGDNPGGLNPDTCVNEAGNSTQGNRLGCPDADGDGWDDSIDALPNLDTQWLDQDGDGYGDNASGLQPDACPGEAGTSTIDRYGCVDDDGDGYSNATDAFPSDPTRWVDSDNDGYDDAEDACPLTGGNSTVDRLGCVDSDGDGVSNPTLPAGNQSGWNTSNGADAFPDDATQVSDQDGDGFGDNATGNQADACPTDAGSSSVDRFGCADEDGDGTSDANDAFLGEATQWSDADNDGFGDNPNGSQPDACPNDSGTSILDHFGCLDADGDGASDENDLWPDDNSQWFDSDGDGFGDEATGTNGDDCPTQSGTSTQGNSGCPDQDGDGWADTEDEFPDQRTQHTDSDGDGYGDNASLGAYRPDHWPNDASRNSAEASMTCTPLKIEVDLAASGWFTFTCTVTTQMNTAFAANVDWEATTSIVGETSNHFLTFTSATGNTQTVTFSGTAKSMGTHQLLLSAREPGATYPMDIVTVRIVASDSNAPVVVTDDAGGSLITVVTDNTMVQAALAGLVLFVLMGMLMIRGKAKTDKENQRRLERVSQMRTQRGITEHRPGGMVQRPQTMARARPPSVFEEFRRK